MPGKNEPLKFVKKEDKKIFTNSQELCDYLKANPQRKNEVIILDEAERVRI